MYPTIASQKYVIGTAKQVRAQSRIPAALYGEGQETKNISIDKQEFRRLYKQAGKATLVEVEVEGKNIPALIHVVDLHPISGDPIHVDFHAVKMDKEVHAVVPVVLTGVSDAVKLLGGILTTMTNNIEIKCLPKHLIAHIEADISALKNFHDTITVGDLIFPEGITVLTAPDAIIASVSAPRKAATDTALEEEGEEEEKEEEKKGE